MVEAERPRPSIGRGIRCRRRGVGSTSHVPAARRRCTSGTSRIARASSSEMPRKGRGGRWYSAQILTADVLDVHHPQDVPELVTESMTTPGQVPSSTTIAAVSSRVRPSAGEPCGRRSAAEARPTAPPSPLMRREDISRACFRTASRGHLCDGRRPRTGFVLRYALRVPRMPHEGPGSGVWFRLSKSGLAGILCGFRRSSFVGGYDLKVGSCATVDR